MRKWLIAATLLGCLGLAACGATTTLTTGGGAPSTSTMTPDSTATPAGPPTLPIKTITAAAANSVCPGFAQPGDAVQQIGGLAFDSSTNIPLAYPGILLPDNLATNTPYATVNPTPSTGMEINPGLGTGYGVGLCNLSSSATAVLQGVGLQVASQTPSPSGVQKDVGIGTCATFFQLPNNLSGGGCGGSIGPHTGFDATWSGTTTVGSTASASQTVVDDGSEAGPKSAFGPLPISIKPGYSLALWVGMTNYPTPNGTYSFQVGLQFSGFAMTYNTLATPPVILLSSARVWDGLYCQGATALIAKMASGKYYFCPMP
ncbi:MAG: hypothetical protein H0X24_18675 [Ktedonobacterales bacterium]|nr:hypothetical protein [Ktedonobacterales bacterium]